MPTFTSGAGTLLLSLRKGESLVIRNLSGTETVTGSTAAREDATASIGSGVVVYGPQTSATQVSITTTGVLDYSAVMGDPTPNDTYAAVSRDASTGLPNGLVDPNTGNSVVFPPTDGVLLTKSGQKIKLVAGVMRNLNDGNGWQLITNATHTNCNVESITQTSSAINVNFPSLGGAKVISFLASPDETLAKAGFTMGSSVTTSQASIELKRRKAVADYISYNGSAWASAAGVFTFVFSAGTLTLTHPTVETSDGLVVSVTGRDGVYDAQAGTAAATTTQVKFYDWAGTLQTTENTNMKAYVNRGVASAASDPATVNESTFPGGNIWFMGVFEMP